MKAMESELQCVLQNLLCRQEMCVNIGGHYFQQMLYHKGSKVVLLITHFECGKNFQLNYVVRQWSILL
jgi:hypothetical protein